MLSDLPTHTAVFRALLGELYDNLPERVARLRLLAALDEDFGGSSLMLLGGHQTYAAYTEARSTFVAGNFLATVLLSLALIENLLAAHLHLCEITDEIHHRKIAGRKSLGGRPRLSDTLQQCVVRGTIKQHEKTRILDLADLRNSMAHFRSLDDPENFDRRILNSRADPLAVAENDATFAITIVIQLLARPEFAVGQTQPTD